VRNGVLGTRRWKFNPGGKAGKGKQQAGELYNLASDPGEQKNVIKDNPGIAGEMAELLRRLRDSEAGVRSVGK